jgi:protein-S-isoprenylcysteine O-methyltransferase
MTIEPAAIFAGATYFLSEAAISLRRRAAKHLAGGDRGSLPVIWAAGFVSIFLAFAAAGSFGLADLPILREAPAIGLTVFGLGLALRGYAIGHLGRFFTVNVAIVDDHRLVDTGPYRWIRHPSYTGWLLAITGLGLCLGNGLSLAILLAPTLSVILWRIGIEEAVLRAAFGETYAAYARKTSRLFPLIY